MKIETVEIPPDETMVTTEGRTNRVIVATSIVKLHRAGKLSDDECLVASEMGNDFAYIRKIGGGGNLERIGEEEFVLMPGGCGGVQGASTNRADACKRIAQARVAIGHWPDFLFVKAVLEGMFTLEEWDEKHRRRRHTASKRFCTAISAVNTARIYETRRYRSQIMAAA